MVLNKDVATKEGEHMGGLYGGRQEGKMIWAYPGSSEGKIQHIPYTGLALSLLIHISQVHHLQSSP